MAGDEIAVDDPRATDVRELLGRHLAFARATTPPEDVHALDIDGLIDSAVTFYGLRREGTLVAVGALKQLDATHAELKSMHTLESARRTGLGRAMVRHLVDEARRRGVRRVSLETGSTPPFAPARALYAAEGFTPYGPFADYRDSPNSTFMTLELA